ncbi:armadillo repeat only 4 protein [Corchorus olitorius]|uniref:Armadillo repeat only 4 protein n=1 Tax=Corchorus olitorius TaxID=93759 RepID=A0A1R3KKA7_9ROSI|nr:armadillo repeat only 4 protein [Corchorus olitorius]
MERFDIARISSIDPFWPTEEKEQSFIRPLVDKNKSNHHMVPTNPNIESPSMNLPIPTRSTVSPRSITSVRFGNKASSCDNDESDGSAGLKVIGIG